MVLSVSIKTGLGDSEMIDVTRSSGIRQPFQGSRSKEEASLDEVMNIPYLCKRSNLEPTMVALLKEESTITAKGQTTVPKVVRQALGVDYGGRIAFFVDDQHRVYVEKATAEASDPVVDGFLEFLARDMTKHPGSSVVALPATLRDRIVALVGNIDVDLDEEIDGNVAL